MRLDILIRKLMIDRGMTIKEFSERTGLSRNWLNQSAKWDPRRNTILKLNAVFGGKFKQEGLDPDSWQFEQEPPVPSAPSPASPLHLPPGQDQRIGGVTPGLRRLMELRPTEDEYRELCQWLENYWRQREHLPRRQQDYG